MSAALCRTSPSWVDEGRPQICVRIRPGLDWWEYLQRVAASLGVARERWVQLVVRRVRPLLAAIVMSALVLITLPHECMGPALQVARGQAESGLVVVPPAWASS